MAIELHHLNTHGMMEQAFDVLEQACDVLDVVVRLKERIAELEKLNHELEEERRWRKCSEELPQNGQDVWAYDSKSKSVLHLEYEKSNEGEGFIVFPYKHDFQQNITQWMPFEKPKAPEETDK